jgi:CheY-like chemotaxis protein
MTKILYVEDNEDNVYMLKRRLTKKGFEVVIAENGAVGVDMSKSEAPDIILMDLSLPVMDGWEATRIIKRDVATQTIPIIVLSANAMEEHKRQALEAGADDYDTKPVDLARLLEKISAQLG